MLEIAQDPDKCAAEGENRAETPGMNVLPGREWEWS